MARFWRKSCSIKANRINRCLVASILSLLGFGITHCLALDLEVNLNSQSPLRSDHSAILTLTWSGSCKESWSSSAMVVSLVTLDEIVLNQETHNSPIQEVGCLASGWELAYSVPIWLPRTDQTRTFRIRVERGGVTYWGNNAYQLAKFKTAPALKTGPDTSLVKGWHNLERDPVSNEVWRWMEQRSTLTLINPFKASVLVITGSIPQAKFREPSGLHIVINGLEIDYLIPEHSEFRVRYELPQFLLGHEPLITLDLETDQVYLPALEGAADSRHLGMMLKHLHFGAQP